MLKCLIHNTVDSRFNDLHGTSASRTLNQMVVKSKVGILALGILENGQDFIRGSQNRESTVYVYGRVFYVHLKTD